MSASIGSPFAAMGNPPGEWTVHAHEGVTMTPERKGDSLRLHIANTSGKNWHAELRCAPIRVTAGDCFDLSFSARADQPFTFSVWLGQQGAPHASLVTEATHFGTQEMTSEWKDYSHRWVVHRAEENGRLNFVLGQVDNTVEIKDVRLQRV